MCDGSGILNEWYVAVDVTETESCPGCSACDEAIAAQLAEDEAQHQLYLMREAMPLWAGLEVYDTPRKPVLPELPKDFRFIKIAERA
jgi:hypothetical protein